MHFTEIILLAMEVTKSLISHLPDTTKNNYENYSRIIISFYPLSL